MNQTLVLQRQTSDQSFSLVGNETEDLLPTSSFGHWEDFAGLSWIFLEDLDFSKPSERLKV